MRHMLLGVFLSMFILPNVSFASQTNAISDTDREYAMKLALRVQEIAKPRGEAFLDIILKSVEKKIPLMTNQRVIMILDVMLMDISLDRQRVWDLKDGSYTIKGVFQDLEGNLTHEICLSDLLYDQKICYEIQQGKAHKSLQDYWNAELETRALEEETYPGTEYGCDSMNDCYTLDICGIKKNNMCYDVVEAYTEMAGYWTQAFHTTIGGKAISVRNVLYEFADFDHKTYDPLNFIINRQ